MQSEQYEKIIATFYEEGTTSETMFVGLASEVGEVMSERVKETRRGAECSEEILDELSDVLFYVTSIAVSRGGSLEKLMNHNVNKLIEREAFGKAGERKCKCIMCGAAAEDTFCGLC